MNIIKALTLWEPWATLMAWGLKTIETRSWSTNHYGLLAIHAAKGWNSEQARFMATVVPTLPAHPHGVLRESSLSKGCIVAIVELVSCGHIYDGYEKRLAPVEAKLGDYSAGRYAWYTNFVYKLETPIPVSGSQGLWDWQMPDSLFNSPAFQKALKDNRR